MPTIHLGRQHLDRSLLGTERSNAIGGVRCAAAHYKWKAPNRVLVIQDSTDRGEATVFGAHAAPQGVCNNLINALKLVANQQKDGDSPVLDGGYRAFKRKVGSR